MEPRSLLSFPLDNAVDEVVLPNDGMKEGVLFSQITFAARKLDSPLKDLRFMVRVNGYSRKCQLRRACREAIVDYDITDTNL